MGFLALDLAKALDLPLYDPNDKNGARRRQCASQGRQRRCWEGSAKARSGGRHQWRGSDLIYLPNRDKKLADRTIKALLEQDYVSGLFVDDKLGRAPPAPCRCRSSR